MRQQLETLGSLKCRLVDDLPDGAKPSLVVILCHGYGASGSDLVPIGEELLDQIPVLQDRVQFIFPEAPLSLDQLGLSGGRAWWPIDMVKLQLANATGRYREMRQECPEGLVDARQKLLKVVATVEAKTGLPLSRIVLGGFSQGAMLTTDSALHLDENVAGLIAMSGTLLHEPEWQKCAPAHSGLPVLQSHGTQDPLLPFAAAEWLRDLLKSADMQVEFIPFRGGHQIPMEVFGGIATFLLGLMAEASE
ncbi:MAG TPA: dienelactone hydrolase family protein [Schlesneria sp.]